MVVDGLTFDQMADLMKEHEVKCPDCGSEEFTEIRQFNLMFKTFQVLQSLAQTKSSFVLKQHKVFS